MKNFRLDSALPPSPAAPADPTPSPPLSGEGRGEAVASADGDLPNGFDKRRRGAPPLQGEGVGVGESRIKSGRPPDWKPSPRAKQLAPHLRRNATEAEKELWWHLRRKLPLEGTHFRRQVPIGPFIVDFCCHGHRLIVELDGGQHSEDAALARDERRDRYLRAHGYRVLRFWNAQVFGEIGMVIDTIAAALAGQLDPTPTPSPFRGGAQDGAPSRRAAP